MGDIYNILMAMWVVSGSDADIDSKVCVLNSLYRQVRREGGGECTISTPEDNGEGVMVSDITYSICGYTLEGRLVAGEDISEADIIEVFFDD